jgi:hypothetical protein
MVDTSELESFLNEKSVKEMEVCEIIEEGVLEEKEDPITKRKYRVLNIPVSCNGRELIYTPNKDAIKIFQKEFGLDTITWKGKKFQVKFYPKTAFGQTRTAILPVILKL